MIWRSGDTFHFQNNQAALEKPGTGSIHQYFHRHRAGYRIHYKSDTSLTFYEAGTNFPGPNIFSETMTWERVSQARTRSEKRVPGKLSQLRWIHQSQFLPQFQSYWFKKSECRGRPNGEHKSNTTGGELFILMRAVGCLLLNEEIWLLENSAKARGGPLLDQHLHCLHHCDLSHYQVMLISSLFI